MNPDDLRRAPAKLAGSAGRMDLLHAVRGPRLSARDVPGRVGHQHAVRVLAAHARDRPPRPLRVDLQHAVRAPRPPRREPALHRQELRQHVVLWDRLFGTYEREREEPVFGTLKPLPATSPLHANVEPWRDLAAAARAAPGLSAKLRVWLGPPAATYATAVASHAPAAPARVSSGATAFAAAFRLLIVATVGYMYLAPSLPALARAGVAIGLMAWLVASAAGLERRRRRG